MHNVSLRPVPRPSTRPRHAHPRRAPRRALQRLVRARTAAAVAAGRLAAATSRRLRVGSGAIIGGRVTLALQPRALAHLTRGRTVVLVTGTNGKTTTTRMIAEAVGPRGQVATNTTGANMPDGHVAALIANLRAPYAVLEVDELHLGQVAAAARPAVVVLLNLSRDQLDRVGEIRTVERSIREAVQALEQATVVANCDDPYIVSAAVKCARVRWVAVGARWRNDALICPRCGGHLNDLHADWWCECGLTRPMPDWSVTPQGLAGADGALYPLELKLPGPANRGNAALATAAAAEVGRGAAEALARIARITHTHGRYARLQIAGKHPRLLLAKNPASWLEALELVAGGGNPLVLVVNSREADGHDVSWLWDVDFDRLAGLGLKVLVAGDRALDLAVRLRYAEVEHELAPSVAAAIRAAPGPAPEILANYTAFHEIFTAYRKSVQP